MCFLDCVYSNIGIPLPLLKIDKYDMQDVKCMDCFETSTWFRDYKNCTIPYALLHCDLPFHPWQMIFSAVRSPYMTITTLSSLVILTSLPTVGGIRAIKNQPTLSWLWEIHLWFGIWPFAPYCHPSASSWRTKIILHIYKIYIFYIGKMKVWFLT